jgi:hypothetical protein
MQNDISTNSDPISTARNFDMFARAGVRVLGLAYVVGGALVGAVSLNQSSLVLQIVVALGLVCCLTAGLDLLLYGLDPVDDNGDETGI